MLAADRAHAHALEALRDGVAEEAERLDRLREELRVDLLVPSGGVVLVHDLEQRLLEGADAVGLRPRVTLLAVVRRRVDTAILHGARQAGGTYAQARCRADPLVHRDAPGMRTRRLRERRRRLERQRRDQ